MRKTIYLCDLCKKELPEKELIEKVVDWRKFEVCEECSTKLEKAQEELNKCREKRDKEMDAILEKYGIGLR